MTESDHLTLPDSRVEGQQLRVAKKQHREPLFTVRADAHLDMMRRETLESLLDPRAKWPDGSVREIGVPLWERMKLAEAARRAEP